MVIQPGGRTVVASVLGFVLAGCAPALSPVRNPGQRVELYGFSVMTPHGAGWRLNEGASGPRRVTFGKPLASGPTPTLLVVASAADVPPEITANDAGELREAMEHWMWERFRVVQGRYFLREYAAAADRSLGAECIQYDLVQDERKNPSPALRGRDLEIRVRGFDCLHPANRRLMIKVYYSLRTERGSGFSLDTATEQEAEGFLRSVVFRAIR